MSILQSYFSANIGALTAAGIKHNLRKQPSQDAFACFENKNSRILALADGCSSAKYAKQGAEATVDAAVSFAQKANLSAIIRDKQQCADFIRDLLEFIRQRLIEISNGIPLYEFASTLLFWASVGKKFMTLQLGDGGIVISHSMNISLLPAKFPSITQKNITYSTYDLFTEKEDIYTVSRGLADFVALMSDGVLTPLQDKAGALDKKTLGSLFLINALYSQTYRKSKLEILLKNATAYTMDDTTILLLNMTTSPFKNLSLEEKRRIFSHFFFCFTYIVYYCFYTLWICYTKMFSSYYLFHILKHLISIF